MLSADGPSWIRIWQFTDRKKEYKQFEEEKVVVSWWLERERQRLLRRRIQKHQECKMNDNDSRPPLRPPYIAAIIAFNSTLQQYPSPVRHWLCSVLRDSRFILDIVWPLNLLASRPFAVYINSNTYIERYEQHLIYIAFDFIATSPPSLRKLNSKSANAKHWNENIRIFRKQSWNCIILTIVSNAKTTLNITVHE